MYTRFNTRFYNSFLINLTWLLYLNCLPCIKGTIQYTSTNAKFGNFFSHCLPSWISNNLQLGLIENNLNKPYTVFSIFNLSIDRINIESCQSITIDLYPHNILFIVNKCVLCRENLLHITDKQNRVIGTSGSSLK